MIYSEKSKQSIGGAIIKLICDSCGIRITVTYKGYVVTHMSFPDTSSGLSYAKRCYNGLQ